MSTLIIVIHIIVCLFLIGIVLIQGGKGAELGSAFGGGSSQTLFGARGAATVLSKITTIMAVIFMITSLILTVLSAKQPSVVKSSVIPAEEKKEQVPLGGVTPQPQGIQPTAPEKAPQEKPTKK